MRELPGEFSLETCNLSVNTVFFFFRLSDLLVLYVCKPSSVSFEAVSFFTHRKRFI